LCDNNLQFVLLNRRQFVRITASGSLLAILPACRQTGQLLPWLALAVAVSKLPDAVLAQAGQRALEQQDAARWRASLPTLPDIAWRATGARSELDMAMVVNRLNRQVQEDFGQARVRQIAGWILSDTEAALCALAAGPAG